MRIGWRWLHLSADRYRVDLRIAIVELAIDVPTPRAWTDHSHHAAMIDGFGVMVTLVNPREYDGPRGWKR